MTKRRLIGGGLGLIGLLGYAWYWLTVRWFRHPGYEAGYYDPYSTHNHPAKVG